jgi:Protein of unknown function (DUF3311)
VTVHEPDRPDRDRRSDRTPGVGAESTRRAERSDHSPWNWLLVLPLLATLFPSLYNKLDPQLFDIPFFYWYQLAAIGISVIVTLIVYTKTRS